MTKYPKGPRSHYIWRLYWCKWLPDLMLNSSQTFRKYFCPPLYWIGELCHAMFSINTKPAYEMKDCRIWIYLKCLFSVSVLWLLGSFMLGFWFEWLIIDFSTKQNLLEVAWVLPTFVYTLPFVLYLGSAKLAMASHFLLRHCSLL